MSFATQFGSSNTDYGHAIAATTSGNVIIGGSTYGSLFGTNLGSFDMFLVELNSTNATTIRSSQFGSSYKEVLNSIAVDTYGNIYLFGYFQGTYFGTNSGGYDICISKYTSTFTKSWSTTIGTTYNEYSNAGAVDSSGNAIFVGYSDGGSLYGSANGNYDILLGKYSSLGTLAWGYTLGTSSEDEGFDVAVDSSGNIAISGYTYGSLYKTNKGYGDIFIVKYTSTGTLSWSKQIGSTEYESLDYLSIDSSGNIYGLGYTYGKLITTSTSASSYYVLYKFSSSGSILWSVQDGISSTYNYDSALSLDSSGSAYLGIYTTYYMYIFKYTAGSRVWYFNFADSKTAYDIFYGISVYNTRIFAVGGTYASIYSTNNSGSLDVFTMEICPTTASYCSKCTTPGQYPSYTTSACSNCASGKYSSNSYATNANVCVSCASGTYMYIS